MEHRMKTPLIPACMLVLLATISAFGQAGVLYSRTNFSVITPTNITAIRIGGQLITNPVGLNLTNRGGSVGVVDTLPTNTLPGLLSGLSVGNGQGMVTNLAAPVSTWYTNPIASISLTNYTYTIPTWARLLVIEAIGPGGPGGSGRVGSAGSLRTGGGGGSGGGYGSGLFRVSDLWTNKLTIQLPQRLSPGSAVTNNDTDGNAGATATAATGVRVFVGTSVTISSNVILRVGSGSGGAGGNNSGAASGGVTTFTYSSGGVSAGGASSATGTAGSAATAAPQVYAGIGGGAGGGIATSDLNYVGGGGAAHPLNGGASTSLAGGATNGVAVLSWASSGVLGYLLQSLVGGPGAPGSGSASLANSANGGDGEYFGSGGGGSGAALNGFFSGSGGWGGPGVCVITAY